MRVGSVNRVAGTAQNVDGYISHYLLVRVGNRTMETSMKMSGLQSEDRALDLVNVTKQTVLTSQSRHLITCVYVFLHLCFMN